MNGQRAIGTLSFAGLLPSRLPGVQVLVYRLGCRCAALLLFVLGGCVTVHGQTLQVTNNGATVNPGDTLKIDDIPMMPQLSLEPAGCDSASYDMDINWTAATGEQTNVQVSGWWTCNEPTDFDWSPVGYAGGTVTIQWTGYDSCGNTTGSANFNFNIVGTNPLPSAVDAMANSPWFFENTIAEESRAWTSAPTGVYHQFDASGFPLNCSCPSGIGLTQLDPPANFDDFWNWSTNLSDGLGVLNGKQAGAATSWSNELQQMIGNNGGIPVWAPWQSGVCTFDASRPSGLPQRARTALPMPIG
ncbi:MAG: hypothetical protein ACRD50_13210 [Candidatus Acidiferrales bacterium]